MLVELADSESLSEEAAADALKDFARRLPSPEAAVEALLEGYDHESLVRAHAARRRVLLPEPRRPRMSPSSLRVVSAAAAHGCFHAMAGPRHELLTTWTAEDERWQTGFVQQHGVVRAESGYDANVEVHDEIHAMLGFAWWPGISLEHFYAGARISEALASYHYYFFDELLEPRCEQHAAIVDPSKILRLHSCEDCQREENLLWNLSPARADQALTVAREYARQGAVFLRHELLELAEHILHGLGPVSRNPGNRVGNLSDSLRYSLYAHPWFTSRWLRPSVELLTSWQRFPTIPAFLAHGQRLIDIVTGARAPSEDGPSATTRGLFVAQDLALRLGTVLYQHETGQRALTPTTRERLDLALEDIASLGHVLLTAVERHDGDGAALAPPVVEQRLSEQFEAILEVPDVQQDGWQLGDALASVGYRLDHVLGTDGAQRDDRTDVTAAHHARGVARAVGAVLPKTAALVDQVPGADLWRAFTESADWWEPPMLPEWDGRRVDGDLLTQRFLHFLERRRAIEEPGWPEVVYERARLEYAGRRFSIRAAEDSDVREAMRTDAARYENATPRVSSALELWTSPLVLGAIPDALTTQDAAAALVHPPATYAISAKADRVLTTALDPAIAAKLDELPGPTAGEPLPLDQLLEVGILELAPPMAGDATAGEPNGNRP
jgi:hypothetical protein